MRSFGKVFRGLWLEGSHPDTKIVIAWTHAETNQEARDEFELWGPVFQASERRRMSPDVLANIVATNMAEP
jgi:hypothetical protein